MIKILLTIMDINKSEMMFLDGIVLHGAWLDKFILTKPGKILYPTTELSN